MPKKILSKQKKMSTRVDFTPMVDMMMLLITFFMLCTTLSKPQTMQLTMPSNDKNVNKNDQSETKASQTITIFIGANNKIYYGEGLPQYTNPGWLKQTTYGKNGIRKVLINHRTEDGTDPVAQIMLAKQKLDAEKLKNPTAWPDSVYQKQLNKLKDGFVNGNNNAPIPTLTVVIKPLITCSYKNLVDVLDEMQICSIGKYVIDKISPDDKSLVKLKGIK
ncbi:MAG: biopolymer transporter ExbD [Prevotella sp.]|jgi:biopolymer transport protein ExbD|nr:MULTISPECIES: biopolymer transporter ExbD [unclassified Prevotella]MCH3970688.1 biopolymer transporter ExbD [Prevotella sp.]MCH3984938.1 biopolymer transporter ExbD [Prevotella sp.]MCH3991504.1 biopolymer transporter ExbD [Prevotella sp.]MCH4018684.1 biopolymer transporter ExbD [Prevotella sp.]MCH4100163.1 biopolymer transporter ExbD [Prevotella sp.]